LWRFRHFLQCRFVAAKIFASAIGKIAKRICRVRWRGKLLKFRMISPGVHACGAGRAQRIINLNN